LQPQSAPRVGLAWTLWLTTFGCRAAGLAVAVAVVEPLTIGVLVRGAADALAFSLGFATVGLILALRRPTNPIGWLYLAAGLAASLTTPTDPWVEQLVRDGRPLPLIAQLVAVAADVGWAPWIALGVTLPALLLPDGHLRSHRWRVVAATAVAGPVLLMVGAGLAPGRLQQLPIDNPFGLGGAAGTAAWTVAYTGAALHWMSLLAAGVCVVLRFRGSRGVQRQQLRWVAAGAAGAVVGLILSIPGTLTFLHGTAADVLTANVVHAAMLCPPIAIAVAVLRYRLWDLDRLISRTVTYAVITVLLIVPYLLILPATVRLAGDVGDLGVAVVTLAAAAGFAPLRRRVQDLVDQRFNRRRYDAARTVDSFTARLRDLVDRDALDAALLAVIEQTVEPTQASLWLVTSTNAPPTDGRLRPRTVPAYPDH
jgi:hypothetical protein